MRTGAMKQLWFLPIFAAIIHQVQGSCEKALGMRNGKINDNKITSPSVRDRNTQPHHARRGHWTTWCSAARRFSYIQVELDREHVIRAVTVEGGGVQALMWVTKYTIRYRRGGSWNWYTDQGGKKKILDGVKRFNRYKKSVLNNVTADAIRIYPQAVDGVSHSSNSIEHACLKLELFGCLAAECKQLLAPVNGQLRGKSFKHPSKVTFSCNVGFRLKGSSALTCTANGTWDSEPPTCHVVDCGRVRQPSNGHMIQQTSTTYNGIVLFACDSGYELTGSPMRRCQADGQWSGVGTNCQTVSCGDPGTPPNSFRELSHGFRYRDTIRFRCFPNHVIVGSALIVCRENRTWNASLPKCLAPCPKPGSPNFGQTIGNNFQHGGEVRFQCALGYVISGQTVVKCRKGKWNAPTPRCMAPCRHPGQPKNGKKLGADYRHGRTVRFRCRSGFKMNGNSSIRCSNGVWKGKKPRCIGTGLQSSSIQGTCPDPIVPANGVLLGTKKLNQVRMVKFKCRPNFSLIGSAVIICVGRRWTRSPQCKESCSDPGVPRNGRRNGTKFTHGQSVTFACDPKYKLEGHSVISCSDGNWTHTIPKCRASCVNPGVPPNGKRVGKNFNHGQVVRFSCKRAYKLEGVSILTCFDGRWSNTLPRCLAPCGHPGQPKNGNKFGADYRHGRTVRFKCRLGFKMIGNNSIRCSNGVWKGKKPRCIGTCPNPIIPANGVLVGIKKINQARIVTFKCRPNFSMIGSAVVICVGRRWTQSPQCKESCSDPGVPQNGRRNGTKFTHGQSVTFACDPKYKLEGHSVISCSDGNWTHTTPKCRATNQYCQNPPIPQGAKLYKRSPAGALFICKSGFYMLGRPYITCTSKRGWSTPRFRCQAKSCGNPGIPKHGNKVGILYTVNEEVRYSCNTGFVLNGSIRRRCLANRTWSGTPPLCNPVDCGPLPAPSHGEKIIETGTTFGHKIVFGCRITGYELSGSQTRICQRDGQWSGSTARCSLVKCKDPGTPLNGTRVVTGGLKYGGWIDYYCNSGYTINGFRTIFCGLDKTWNGPVPTCTATPS